MIKSYKDLEVWQRSIELVKDIYAITREFPAEERFGLASQLRKTAISVPSNIAEGKARHFSKEYVQFLYIALGSVAELETQIIIARELGYIADECAGDVFEEIDHIGRMLRKLIEAIKK